MRARSARLPGRRPGEGRSPGIEGMYKSVTMPNLLHASLLGLAISALTTACGPVGADTAGLAPPGPTAAAPAPLPAAHVACASPAACEALAASRLDAARGSPAALTDLLRRFPKGGDLHNHYAGAVYAESYLGWARADGLRVDDHFTLVDAAKCGPSACADLPTSAADPRFDTLVRAWSMKDFQPGAESGHDHFFAAFSRFGVVSHEAKRQGAMLAETMRRAADDGAVYLEVLLTVVRPPVSDIAKDAGALDPQNFPAFEQKLRADARWPALLASSRQALAEIESSARAELGCAASPATPACRLTVRYVAQVGRTAPAPQIFAEFLAAFEVSQAEPHVAGVNLVSPEDNATALQDYDLQMAILGFLGAEFRGRSPLRVTLHAGELTPALVPSAHPEYLKAHIRNAVEIAHAERIGHGVDVLSERDAQGLLAEMHQRGVTVEICLSSNAIILGVSGAAHPLGAYLSAGVPVVLATDDAGVSRSSLTGEYARAVAVQGITYPQLKAMARRSLTAAFVPGASLWASGASGASGASVDSARAVEACAGPLGAEHPPDACAQLLASSERARLQWTLEGQLAAFEADGGGPAGSAPSP
jgi:adenosine deaminase